MQNTTVNQNCQLLSAKELAKMLSLSKRQIFRLNSCHRIPEPIRIGGSIRWSSGIISNWLAAGAPDRKTFEALQNQGGENMLREKKEAATSAKETAQNTQLSEVYQDITTASIAKLEIGSLLLAILSHSEDQSQSWNFFEAKLSRYVDDHICGGAL